MFGYIRPLKSEMLVRELVKYKAVYCGICKQISEDYGQLPRMTVGYDITMMALLLLALTEDQPVIRQETCLMNPLQRRPVIYGGDIFSLCAALSVLMACYKAEDDVRDEKSLRGRILLIFWSRARKKARRKYREYDAMIDKSLRELAIQETEEPDPKAAEIFARLMGQIFAQAADLVKAEKSIRDALQLMGRDLGAWVYLLDAIDDLASDCDNKRWNPLAGMSAEAARRFTENKLVYLEESIDRTAALLPYKNDSGLVQNIITLGLPEVRKQILAGNRLFRI